MITSTTTARSQPRPETTNVRTVALCHIDPDRFVVPPQGMPGVSGTRSLITVFQCAEAIEAALHGDIDVLVVDGNRIGLPGLNALSFLNQERPKVPIYLYHEEDGAAPRLLPWDSLI